MSRSASGSARPLDYVFLLRPAALVPLWVFVLYGATLAERRSGVASGSTALPPELWLGLVAMSLILGGGYIQNQIADIETDRRNEKLFLLPRGIVTVRAARIELAAVWGAAAVALVWLPPAFRWVAAGSVLLCATYSWAPIRAKARAPLDLLWNGLGFGALGAAAGWTALAPVGRGLFEPAVAYVLAVAGIIASTTIPDLDGDRVAGLRTTAAVLGERRTSLVAIILLGAAAVVGWRSRDLLALWGPLLALPLLLRAHATRRRADRVLADQVGVVAFVAVASFRSPWLLALFGAALVASRCYYARRFGIAYPGPGTP